MFDKERYITSHANGVLPMELQILLWKCIDEWRRKIEQDYLKVFELSISIRNGKEVQVIKHYQEEPKYQEEIEIMDYEQLIVDKVYVIDDGEYSTMLMASDYQEDTR